MAPASVVASRGPTPSGPYCAGDYADDLGPLLPRVRDFERDPANQYSYCLRTIATYECLSYASDGSVRRARKTAIAHGTGFAYRRQGGDTFLVTNDHVATWPAVTDDEHPVDDVPSGCKLVAETLKIVDDESDDYEANDIPLSRIVDDPTLDVAILKTHKELRLIPYRVGRSATLRVGNVVAVHGFPLGAFAATNLGKVVNAYDHDTEHDWDHVDFVVDALLSPGNSGSPVLAVSCKTGEYELVGVYHAGYVSGSALNVVVGIDQVRDLMRTLKRASRHDVSEGPLGPEEREVVRAGVAASESMPFFPFGSLVAAAHVLPSGALVYEVYSKRFPLRDDRLLIVEDLPSRQGYGQLGRVYLGNERGLRSYDRGVLDADAQAQLGKILARLRDDVVRAIRYRAADLSTRAGHKQRVAIERDLARDQAKDRDAAQALGDLADRLGPKFGDTTLSWREALRALPDGVPPPSPPEPPLEPTRSAIKPAARPSRVRRARAVEPPRPR